MREVALWVCLARRVDEDWVVYNDGRGVAQPREKGSRWPLNLANVQ
jgi:hypothetical protein